MANILLSLIMTCNLVNTKKAPAIFLNYGADQVVIDPKDKLICPKQNDEDAALNWRCAGGYCLQNTNLLRSITRIGHYAKIHPSLIAGCFIKRNSKTLIQFMGAFADNKFSILWQ